MLSFSRLARYWSLRVTLLFLQVRVRGVAKAFYKIRQTNINIIRNNFCKILTHRIVFTNTEKLAVTIGTKKNSASYDKFSSDSQRECDLLVSKRAFT